LVGVRNRNGLTFNVADVTGHRLSLKGSRLIS
jgi:hypothetical protein